jgi:general secretion pathway protein G
MKIVQNLKKAHLGDLAANQRGMTLVEIMIVVTIMASIMGVVGFFVFGALDEANKKEARIEIGQLSQMVESYYLTTDPHKLPDQLEDLNDKNLVKGGEIPTDPWGNEYVYRKNGREFEIISAGPDGQEGTEDDISSANKGGGNS